MQAWISIRGKESHCWSEADVGGQRSALDEATLAQLRAWAERYGRAVLAHDSASLAAIGEELFGWLDVGG